MKVIYKEFDGVARTNGRDIEINIKYQGSSFEKLFIFHEEGHILLNHFKRQGNRDHELWNIAADLEIAIYLYPLQDFFYDPSVFESTKHFDNINEAIKKVEELSRYIYWEDEEYKLMGIKDYHTAEEIYDILKSQRDDNSGNSDANGRFTKIEEDAKTCSSFHGPQRDWEQTTVSELGDNEQSISEVLETIDDAVKSCQLARKVTVKKLKINPAITNSINSIGKGSLGFRKTYSRPCRSKVGLNTDRVYRGERTVETKTDIFIFVDRSGSFNSDKTRDQERAVKDLANKFRGRLKVKILYFTTKVFEDENSITDKGTNAYSCFQYIDKYRPDMSIIITDDDTCYGYELLDLKGLKVGFIFIGCDENRWVTEMVPRFNGTLINKTN